MKTLAFLALLLLAAVGLPVAAEAHNSTCGYPYVDCLHRCQVTDHIGTPPPHKCALEAPLAPASDESPVRVERCPESNQYEVTVLGRRLVSCTH